MSEQNIANVVTWSLVLSPDNAEKIDQINRVILGNTYTAGSTVETKPETKTKPKTETKPEAKTETKDKSDGPTLVEFKAAAKKVKLDHGEDFAKSVVEESGTEVKSTYARTLSAVPEEDYSAIMAAWLEGPTGDEDLEDDGDLEDDEDLEDAPDADTVKTAVRAYAKENGNADAKTIMKKHGASALSEIPKLDGKSLAALFAEVN